MNEVDVRDQIRDLVYDSAMRYGSKTRKIDNDRNLMKQGILDSVALVELLAVIENRFNIRIDFVKDNPDLFSNINGLVEIVLKHS